MKPTSEVWLEIVKERLAAGESAVLAISKAQLVTNAYCQRFSDSREPFAWFEQFVKEGQKKNEDITVGSAPGSYVSGDENAR